LTPSGCGYRTLEAVSLVKAWPGSTHNGISGWVGRWRQTGQDAVNRALGYELIENRGTPYRFALYITDKGLAALDDAWPLFADDAYHSTGGAADVGAGDGPMVPQSAEGTGGMIIRVTRQDVEGADRVEDRVNTTVDTSMYGRPRVWMGPESFQTLRKVVDQDGEAWCEVPDEQMEREDRPVPPPAGQRHVPGQADE
jgi:hypothetical protein